MPQRYGIKKTLGRQLLPTTHSGWMGVPYKSNFESAWGLIKLSDIADGSHCGSASAAAEYARLVKKDYVICRFASRLGSRLYFVRKSSFVCVYIRLEQHAKSIERNKKKYKEDPKERARVLINTARKRSGFCTLTVDDIASRIDRGFCEATGMAFTKGEVRHPFAPSLDQINPGNGYTCVNVRVVCTIYNQMKGSFDENLVSIFIDHLRSKEYEKGCTKK